ncbi:hypothetical protein L1987_10041 [Smallanthus sonchifolius]|uniref:Uncharacterized protein n=1 Tax=Smallanthus sonchifolius TaxID=185202 RepID=A0ACB9JQZ6_9ASTR|nr:hypothetical protein L1987_10041 [Smallanthus sonchifolius]
MKEGNRSGRWTSYYVANLPEGTKPEDLNVEAATGAVTADVTVIKQLLLDALVRSVNETQQSRDGPDVNEV